MKKGPRLLTFILGILAGAVLMSAVPLSFGETQSRQSGLIKGDEFMFGKNIYRIDKVTEHANGTMTYRLELK